MNNRMIERFFNYVRVYTTSDPEGVDTPSTARQFDLAKIVKADLEALKLQDIVLDEHCYLTATLPANIDGAVPTVGFVAHLDTAPDYCGENVNPLLHNNYQGGDIILKNDIVLTPAEFPFLKYLVGHDVITADGTTLLGSDDKAGVVEIIEMVNFLIDNPSIKHGDIKLLFTPDEEIGKGIDKINLANFQADFAYTVDGGAVGEMEYENFNGASLKVYTKGRSIHPGSAKDKMINAIKLAIDFNAMLPVEQVPEKTTGYQGFFHLMKFDGDVDSAYLDYIIRDHDRAEFEAKKDLAIAAVETIKQRYGEETIRYKLVDSYYNMKEKIEPNMHVVDNVVKAMKNAGIEPIIKPIRGGTDGSKLSFLGIPTPNICTGGYNFHGPYELNTVQNMTKTVEILVELVKIIGQAAS